MRAAITIFLALLFAPAAWAALGTHSVLSYTSDADAVTDSVRDSDLHGFAVSAGERIVAEEIRQSGVANQELENLVRAETRTVVGRALDPEWLYSSFATLYRDARRIALEEPGAEAPETPETPEVIEFGDRKKALGDGLVAIADTIDSQCERIFGAAPCRDQQARQAAKEAYGGAVSRTLDGLPDRFSATDLLARTGRNWLDADSHIRRKVRRAAGVAHLVRIVAVGLAALCLLLIIMTHLSSLSRLLIALGAVLAVTGVVYLAGTQFGDRVAVERVIESRLDEQAAPTPRMDPVGEVARQAGTTVTTAVARDGLHHADPIALGLAGIGAIALLGGLLGYRRR